MMTVYDNSAAVECKKIQELANNLLDIDLSDMPYFLRFLKITKAITICKVGVITKDFTFCNKCM